MVLDVPKCDYYTRYIVTYDHYDINDKCNVWKNWRIINRHDSIARLTFFCGYGATKAAFEIYELPNKVAAEDFRPDGGTVFFFYVMGFHSVITKVLAVSKISRYGLKNYSCLPFAYPLAGYYGKMMDHFEYE